MTIEQLDHSSEYYGNGGRLAIPTGIGVEEKSIETEEAIKEKMAILSVHIAHIKETWGNAGAKAAEHLTRIREESKGGNFTILLVGNLKRDRVCPPLIELLSQNGPFNLIMVSPQKLEEMTILQKCLCNLSQAPVVSISTVNNLSIAVQGEVVRVKKREAELLRFKEAEKVKRELFSKLFENEPALGNVVIPTPCIFFYFTEAPLTRCSRLARFSLNRRVIEGIEQLRANNRLVIVLNEEKSNQVSS